MKLVDMAKEVGVASKRSLTRLVDVLEDAISKGEVTATAEGFTSRNEVLAALRVPKSGQYVKDERLTNWDVSEPEKFLEDYRTKHLTVSRGTGNKYEPKATTAPFYQALNNLSAASKQGKGLEKAVAEFLDVYALSQPVMKTPPLENYEQPQKLPKGYSLNEAEAKVIDGRIVPLKR